MMSALSLHQLTKTYANGVQALKGINFNVAQGDFFALLGPNGAGKSTTIGIVCSLVNKSAGTVRIFDHDLDKEPLLARKFIGIVPQEFNFNIFETVQQILLNQAGFYGVPAAIALERSEIYLKQLGLWDKRNESAGRLSGGMKRRLLISRALIHEPPLLILDEPTAGVDIELRRLMWDFLRDINKKGTTIILTTHYLEEAENLCRNIAIIDEGLLVENTSMKKLLQQLNTETFIFYVKNHLTQTPMLRDFHSYLLDENTLAVELNQGQSLNIIFEQFSQQKIEVLSMRNKTNRLEELFIKLVGANKKIDESLAEDFDEK